MLSFLRDQSLEDLPAQKKMNATAGKAPGDGTEKSQESEYLTVAAQGKRVRKSTTLLAVLFIIGLLCLWFMIKKSAPKSASASAGNTKETLIETAIARLTGVKSQMFSRMDEIVGKFYEFSEVPQVKVNELAKNPFELETFSANLEEKPGAEGKGDEIDANMLWQQQMRRKSQGMQLWSIMQSNQGNRCMIDDKILREGDSIKGFKVLQIGDSFVKLESNGVEIVLKLSE
jgi:preprotein translocase subunit SecG